MKTCLFCPDILEMLRGAVEQGLRFSPKERATMVASAEKSIAENTPILLARIRAGVKGAKYTGWEIDMLQRPMQTDLVQ